jgi:asparagine synthetase B (glutamine-hydrolysing)
VFKFIVIIRFLCGVISGSDTFSFLLQDSSRTLWFGRDAFGRRSLLVHWPTEDDSTFLLSSVSPVAPDQQATGM